MTRLQFPFFAACSDPCRATPRFISGLCWVACCAPAWSMYRVYRGTEGRFSTDVVIDRRPTTPKYLPTITSGVLF